MQNKHFTFPLQHLLIISVIFWLCTGTSYADEPEKKHYLLKGMVVDEQQQPIENANIWSSNALKGTVSNQEGIFTLFLPVGTNELTISCIGYESQTRTLNAQPDSMIVIQLSSKSILCEGIIVSSSYAKQDDPISVSNLDRSQLQNKNIEAALPYVIELEPSMVASSENGTQVGNTSFRLRGSDASRINININGVPLNDPESQQVFWVNIPNLTNMAQTVQIQRGIGANTGGTGTFGGAVSLQTLSPKENFSAMADLSLGSFNTFQATVNIGSGITKHGFSVDGSFTHLNSDGYIRNGYCDHQSLFLSLGKYGKKSLLKFISIIGQEHTGITWNGTPSDMLKIDRTYNNAGEYYDEAGNVRYYDNESDNYWQQIYQLYYSYAFNKAWQLNLTGDYTHGYGYYENYIADAELGSMGVSAQTVNDSTYYYSDVIRRECMKNHYGVGVVSVNYTQKKIDLSFGETFTYYHGFYYGRMIWSKYNENINGNVTWYENTSHKLDATTFAKMTVNLHASWSLYTDLQYRFIHYVIDGQDNDMADMYQKNIYHFFNPKIGFTYHPNNPHKVYFVAGIANREPTRSDIKDATKYGAQEVPTAEHMLDVEIGYDYNPSRWKIGANIYFMGYKDQLTSSGRLNDLGYPIKENVDLSYRLGIEISGGVRVCHWFKIDANLSLSQNKVLDYVYYEDTYDNPTDWNALPQTRIEMGNTDLAFSPNIIGAAIFTFEPCKGLQLDITGKYVGKQYIDNTSRITSLIKDYYIMNAKVAYTLPIKKDYSIEFQFQVNNIFNTKYVNNGWGYSARFADGSESYYTDGMYAQPGTNFVGRLIFKL
ncbi:MAG: TonB-dependent receptor [Bacteroidales bacterium]|nr:TonB-dependent receptor [Bacteroidales bacterium]